MENEPKPKESTKAPHHYGGSLLNKITSKFSGSDYKKLGIMAGFLVLLLVISLSITGFVTNTENIEQQLNETRENLTLAQNDIAACSSSLLACEDSTGSLRQEVSQKESAITSCRSDLSTTQADLSSVTASNQACQSDLTSAKADATTARSDYKAVVSNTARDLCCSFADASAGREKRFSISSNSIVCSDSGSNAVHCATGATNLA